MLDRLNKLFSSGKLRIPLIGLLLLTGVIGAKPVLSKQLKLFNTNTILATEIEMGNQTWLQGDINHRQVRQQKNKSVNKLNKAHQIVLTKIAVNKLNHKPKLTALVDQPQRFITNTNTTSQTKLPHKDGIYLYGESPKPNQAGQGYIVFQRHHGKVIGALYMPNSEFSCFNGSLNPKGELAMTVKANPDERGDNEVADNRNLPQFKDNQPSTYAYSVALQNYHQLSKVSANDRQILQTCVQNQE